MAIITWNESLMVGIPDIDKQHQSLVVGINNLQDAMAQGKGKDFLEHLLDDMLAYSTIHFSTEENYFEKFNYDDAQQHIKEHRAFAKKVVEFKTDYEAGKALLSIEIMTFLRDWLIHHIMVVDKKYYACFKAGMNK